MEDVLNNFGNFGKHMNMAAMFKNNDITPAVQKHLTKVYVSLVFCILAAIAGVVAHMRTGMGHGFLAPMGTVGMLIWMQMDSDKTNDFKRTAMLCGFGFLKGASIGPLISVLLFIDPAIIMTALMGTITIFVCFSLSALVAKRSSYLYLGGFLSSALTLLCFLSIANMFFGSVHLYNLQLYGGLMVFSGFVIFDTQLILESTIMGNRDFAGHAANLFVDFVAIFIRLAIIIAKMNEKNSDKKKRSGNR
jgi:FtsH-binding integral membrane protein